MHHLREIHIHRQQISRPPISGEPTVVIFFGAPGAGKGTQAAHLTKELGIPAISTGDMLRSECKSGSEIGRAVQSVLAAGQLVSDELMNKVVANRLAQRDCQQGFILDGYPRTVSQARFLKGLLKSLGMPAPMVIHLDIAASEIVSRLEHRLQCAACGKVFSTLDDADIKDLTCCEDGAKLVRRADDNAEAIAERIRVYNKTAEGVLAFYRGRHFNAIRANQHPDAVASEIMWSINKERGLLYEEWMGSRKLIASAAMQSAHA